LEPKAENGIAIYISIDSKVLGKFEIKSELRHNIAPLLNDLKSDYNSYLLSGDSNLVEANFTPMFPEENIIKGALPNEKQSFIKNLQNSMMIGDGINDSLAFNEADIAIAVTEKTGSFFPSSDALIKAESLGDLNKFFKLSKYSKIVLRTCLVFSILYNSIGLSLALTNNLSPIHAAILMPLSSASVVLIAYFMVLFFRNKNLK